MGWIEDSVEEFRKLPTAGKVAVGGAAVGVAILAYAQYRASQASGQAGGQAGSASTSPASTTASGLPTLGVPSLSSSPADWANWFSQGLTIPSGGQTSDGAPPSVTGDPVATFTSPANGSGATSASIASAHVRGSSGGVTPKPQPKPQPKAAPVTSFPIQNPTVAQTLTHIAGPIPSAPIQNPMRSQTIVHRGTTFIPTTIRPLPTPGRGRVA